MARLAAGGIGALPGFAADVPVGVHSARAVEVNAKAMRLLLDAGAIRECDVPAGRCDPMAVCEAASRRWLNQNLGPLRCLSPSFALTPVRADEAGAIPLYGRGDGVRIAWGERDVRRWDVGGGLEWLEEVQAGLGASVLVVLDARCRHLYPLFTPTVALEVASFLYWYGEEDEELALEETCGTEEEREAMRAEMVTRALVCGAFPAWALGPPALAKSVRLLRRAVCDATMSEAARRVATMALALSRLRPCGDFAPDLEGIFIGYGAVLCWRPDDVAMRISDDLAQYAWQDEYVAHAGEVRIALDDPAAMRLWMRRMRTHLRGIGLVDALIWMLTEGYCSEETGA